MVCNEIYKIYISGELSDDEDAGGEEEGEGNLVIFEAPHLVSQVQIMHGHLCGLIACLMQIYVLLYVKCT